MSGICPGRGGGKGCGVDGKKMNKKAYGVGGKEGGKSCGVKGQERKKA